MQDQNKIEIEQTENLIKEGYLQSLPDETVARYFIEKTANILDVNGLAYEPQTINIFNGEQMEFEEGYQCTFCKDIKYTDEELGKLIKHYMNNGRFPNDGIFYVNCYLDPEIENPFEAMTVEFSIRYTDEDAARKVAQEMNQYCYID